MSMYIYEAFFQYLRGFKNAVLLFALFGCDLNSSFFSSASSANCNV